MSHSVFVAFLVMLGLSALASLSIRGCGYYLTPLDQRPFRADYSAMKPSGQYSHGLGAVGALMIITGVATYSTRKRVRALWAMGKLSRWLECHIFLCLLGPVLVVYHTTFKVGGVAALSFWTMLSVVASGVIGRFLYVQIPRNVRGAQLSANDIKTELEKLSSMLESSQLGWSLVHVIDEAFSTLAAPKSITQTFSSLIRLQFTKTRTEKKIRQLISQSRTPYHLVKQLREAASSRASLIQKSMLLAQVERIFFYWHAVHLPFTVIMFVTLALHVTVVVLLGYTWVLH
jgi:hypothetical protein